MFVDSVNLRLVKPSDEIESVSKVEKSDSEITYNSTLIITFAVQGNVVDERAKNLPTGGRP